MLKAKVTSKINVLIIMLCLVINVNAFGSSIEDRINLIKNRSQLEIENADDRIDVFKSILSKKAIKHFDDYIFVGDSRIIGQEAASMKYHYIGKVAEGYYWLVNSAMQSLNEMANSYPDAAIILCLGVNDFGNINSYISVYSDIINAYGKDRVYIMSVNPIDDWSAADNGYFARNGDVINFNYQMQSAFPDNYIDTYSYLVRSGFGSSDGVHYDNTTYLKIEDYVENII